ncbi:MAG: Ig-like domain repeat protein, partial [Bacilli bacterium]|nr:Ig-like domain repeat protein [Bacilli bacterium]
VITLNETIENGIKTHSFIVGADESLLFSYFKTGISAVDDVDGEITITDDMIDLGGLTPNALVAGDYTITITVSDAAGNEAKKEIPIHVSDYANLTLDFMDGTVGQPYASADWTREKYTTDGWTTITGNMNCREKDGVRVVNFVGGNSTAYQYTYNKGGTPIGVANKLTFKAGNYYDPKQPIPIKVLLIDKAGNKTYLIGSADEFVEFAVTTGLVDQEFTFDAKEVVSIVVVTKSTYNGSCYVYVGDMHLTYVTE